MEPWDEQDWKDVFQEGKELIMSPSCPLKIREKITKDIGFDFEKISRRDLYLYVKDNYKRLNEKIHKLEKNFFLNWYEPSYLYLAQDILNLFEIIDESRTS